MNSEIIAIANHKGGVGKTTTAATVGSILASKGKRVLLIDLDGQANLTSSLYGGELEDTVYDALVEETFLPIVHITDNLDLVPSDLNLTAADLQLSSRMARERILHKVMKFPNPILEGKTVVEYYDIIIIDTPPSLGILTLNALAACDSVIIPLIPEVLPTTGLITMQDCINSVRENINPRIYIKGILVTRWERSNIAMEIYEGLRSRLPGKIFEQRIRKSIRVAEAPSDHLNVIHYSPSCNGSLDYKLLVEEMYPGTFTSEELKELRSLAAPRSQKTEKNNS